MLRDSPGQRKGTDHGIFTAGWLLGFSDKRFGFFGKTRRGIDWKVSEWLAASLEMMYPERGCGFESRAFRSLMLCQKMPGPEMSGSFDLWRFLGAP